MLRSSLLAVVLALSLSACSGGDPAEPGASPNQTPEPGATTGEEPGEEPDEEPDDGAGSSYLAVPAGVTLTEPGTALGFGDVATVAFPIAGGEVGVLEARVDAVTEVTVKEFRGWLSPQALEQSRPYFVRVRLVNAGDTELGGHDVPVHLLDDNGTLGPPWAFDGKFRPCQSGPLPKRFGPGDKAKTCLVYLAPMQGAIESMAFVPDAAADPVTWSGKVETPRTSRKASGKSAGKNRRKGAGKGR
jgi:hypothetical protein